MTAIQFARENIHQQVRDEIRRLSVAHIRITLETAIGNWQFLFEMGRYSEARAYWRSTVMPMMEGT